MTEDVCKCGFAGPHKLVDIHLGQSTRRDCGQCNRTLGFPIWYGVREEGCQLAAVGSQPETKGVA